MSSLHVKMQLTAIAESAYEIIKVPFENDIRQAYGAISDWINAAADIVDTVDQQFESIKSDFSEVKSCLISLRVACGIVKNRVAQLEQYAKEAAIYVQDGASPVQQSGEQLTQTTNKIRRLTRTVSPGQMAA